MKLLFVSGLYTPELIDDLRRLSRGQIQNAPNAFQWGIIEGLMQNKSNVEVVSFPFLPGYPLRYRRMFTPESDVLYAGASIGKVVSYNAFLLFKHLSIENRLRKYLQHWITQNYTGEEDLWIISYTPYSFFSYPIIELKRKYPRVRYCAIIADLIDDATNPTFKLSFMKKIQAKREQKLIWASYRDIDKFVLLSKQMEEKIPESVGRNLVIEGLASSVSDEPVELKSSSIKTVLYTGTLQEFTGILDLITAFKMTDDSSYRLVICGEGVLSNVVKLAADEDNRIDFRGNLPREDVLALQRHATLLINPRKPTISLTRYSFPSKTMEYMASGTPMLGYKLDGIPQEYYNHMFIPKDLSIDSLADTLNVVLSMSARDLQIKGIQAKEFIRKNKVAFHQVRKILQFLES